MRSQRLLLLPTPALAIRSYALTSPCRQAINDMFEVWLLYISSSFEFLGTRSEPRNTSFRSSLLLDIGVAGVRAGAGACA